LAVERLQKITLEIEFGSDGPVRHAVRVAG
jgi:hypothetical protein